MKKDLDLIILAAGSGTRTGLDINKALYMINYIPVFMYSINNLKSYVDNIILVYRKEDYETIIKYVDDNIILVEGGNTRNESVRCGLTKVTSSYVMIHDACRIFTSSYALDELISIYKNYLGSLLVSKEVNTIYKNIDNNLFKINREEIICAETPQIVNTKEYLKALKVCCPKVTDDISVLLNYDPTLKIGLVYTNGENFKITNKKDLALAKMVLEDV